MKKVLVIALGILISLTAMWVGSYYAFSGVLDTWAEFPAFMTAGAGIVGGILLSIYAGHNL
jgi:hypothetical protein